MPPKKRAQSSLDDQADEEYQPAITSTIKRQKIQGEHDKSSLGNTIGDKKDAKGKGVPNKQSTVKPQSSSTAQAHPKLPKTKAPLKSELIDQVTGLNEQIRELEKQNEKLKKMNARLQDKDEGHMQTIQALQEKCVAATQQGLDFVQDDPEIMGNMQILSTMIYDWAASAAYEGSVEVNLSVEDAGKVIELLLGQRQDFPYSILGQSAASHFSRLEEGVRASVQSILEHVVAHLVLTKPFHFLRQQGPDDPLPSEVALEKWHASMNGESACSIAYKPLLTGYRRVLGKER